MGVDKDKKQMLILLHKFKFLCNSDMSLTEIDILDQCITDLIINTQESKALCILKSNKDNI